jgi:hypothetical protein
MSSITRMWVTLSVGALSVGTPCGRPRRTPRAGSSACGRHGSARGGSRSEDGETRAAPAEVPRRPSPPADLLVLVGDRPASDCRPAYLWRSRIEVGTRTECGFVTVGGRPPAQIGARADTVRPSKRVAGGFLTVQRRSAADLAERTSCRGPIASVLWLMTHSTLAIAEGPRLSRVLSVAWSHRLLNVPEPDPEPRPKPSLGALFSNWTTYDASFATKLRLTVSNNLIKLRKRQDCCGNFGQPGC